MAQIPEDLEKRIEQLENEAEEIWGEKFHIQVNFFRDGDISIQARHYITQLEYYILHEGHEEPTKIDIVEENNLKK